MSKNPRSRDGVRRHRAAARLAELGIDVSTVDEKKVAAAALMLSGALSRLGAALHEIGRATGGDPAGVVACTAAGLLAAYGNRDAAADEVGALAEYADHWANLLERPDCPATLEQAVKGGGIPDAAPIRAGGGRCEAPADLGARVAAAIGVAVQAGHRAVSPDGGSLDLMGVADRAALAEALNLVAPDDEARAFAHQVLGHGAQWLFRQASAAHAADAADIPDSIEEGSA